MSINNSLTNFGTPGLNGDRSAVFQPIFKNRFRITTYNFGSTNEVAPYDMTRQCKGVTIPKQTFEEQKLYTYSMPTYVVNRAEWEPITLKFHDDINNTVFGRIQNQLAKQMNFFDQTFSRAGENYKFDMDIDVLAGGASAGGSSFDPNIVRKYSIAGAMLLSPEYGEMATEDQAPTEISITVRFDNCVTFDQNGNQLGTFSHDAEISSQTGILTTLGVASGSGISVSGVSVSLGGDFSFATGSGGN